MFSVNFPVNVEQNIQQVQINNGAPQGFNNTATVSINIATTSLDSPSNAIWRAMMVVDKLQTSGMEIHD